MKRVVIFGTGISAEKILVNLRKDTVSVVAFADNNIKKQGTMFHGVRIISPEKLLCMEFDYIVIASVKYEIITKQLLKLGVDSSRLLAYFAFHHADYEYYREIMHMEGMIYDEMNLRLDSMQKYISNMRYEIADSIDKNIIKIPVIKTIDETIDEIIDKRLSISRYGDGEFDQIDGRREGYQEPDIHLSERLKEVLVQPVPGHVVGLADIYGDLSHLSEKYADYFRNVLIKYRQSHYKYIDMDRVYYNAFISRIYSEMKDKSLAVNWFKKMREIWRKRDVVLVEGDRTRFGVGNDLLEGALSIKRILCPNEGAFAKYEKILERCKSFRKDSLFLLALGPSATILAYDLAKEGFQAIDIGHLDIEYEWYLKGVKEHKVAIQGKYTNEVVGGDIVEEIYDKRYLEEIVTRI